MKSIALIVSSALLAATAHAGTTIDASATRNGNCVLKSNDDIALDAGARNETCILTDEEEISEASYSGVTAPAPKEYDEFGSDLGVEQTIDANNAEAILETIEEARRYMAEEVMVDEKYAKTRDICQNKHKDCTFWSVLGECENNPAYMHVNCGPVCQTCEVSFPYGFKFLSLKISLTQSLLFADASCRD